MEMERQEHQEINMEDKLKGIAQHALTVAANKGVAAEAYVLYEREFGLEVNGGEVQNLKQAEQIGLGLRIIKDKRIGFAYTTDLSLQAVMETVEKAILIARYTSADDYNVFPGGKFSYPAVPSYDPAIAAVTIEDKIDLARQTENYARMYDKRVSVIERSAYDDNEFICVIMNTEDLCASGRGNFCGMHIYLAAEQKGDTQTGFASVSTSRFLKLHPQELGVEAAARAVRSLGARSIASSHLPCLFEPAVTVRFLSIIAQLVDAGAVQKNKSMFADKLGQCVAAPVLNLADDGINSEGLSFPFDAEGIPVTTKMIIEKGVLTGYLYDTYTAGKSGVQSTGNAQRASFRSLPSVGTTNFIVLPGPDRPELLMDGIERGVYITDVMGMHTANPISGDFSVGAAGIMIEKGRLTYPVRGITIAGNLSQLLQNIEATGSDVRFFGSRAAPTLRIKSLSIGGD